MKKILVIAFLGLLIQASCKKEDSDPQPENTSDTTAPVITVVNPVPHLYVDSGDAIHFKINITDETELEWVHLEIKTLEDEQILHIHADADSTAYSFDTVIIARHKSNQYGFIVDARDTAGNIKQYTNHVHIH